MGDIIGGIASIFSGSKTKAPQIPQNIVTKNFSSPFYNLNNGVLTAKPGAASPLDYRKMLAGLQGTQADYMGLRAGLRPIQGAVSGVSSNLSSLYGELRPGFGRLTEARVKTIRDAAAAAVGDLRTQMQQRNVLGSSFAADAEARTKLAFAQQEEQARAEAIVQETALSTEILQKQLATQAVALGISEEDRAILMQSAQNYLSQANVLNQQITTELNQLGVSGQITNQASQIAMQGAIQQAQLDMLQKNINNAAIVGGITSVANSLLGPAATLFGGGGAAAGYAGGTFTNPLTGLRVGGV